LLIRSLTRNYVIYNLTYLLSLLQFFMSVGSTMIKHFVEDSLEVIVYSM
jgi:hypothetical protein